MKEGKVFRMLLLAVIILLTCLLYVQVLRADPPSLLGRKVIPVKQRVIVDYQGQARWFVREGQPGGTYGSWKYATTKYHPAPPGGVRSYSIYWKPCPPTYPRAAMGDEMWRHFERHRAAVRSGIFNYSDSPRYDPKGFAGDKYGTKERKR